MRDNFRNGDMPQNKTILKKAADFLSDKAKVVQRSLREFLAIPSLIIGLFFLLAILVYGIERSQFQFSSPAYDFFKSHVFADSQATSDLLGNIAGSIITVTSITITLLLLIVQQSASNMTSQVFDQFLRRGSNQFYFGYFVGVAVYTLITLATVAEPFNPVLAAMLAFFFTVIALFMLLVLFYSTIHQMRSHVILGAIYDLTLTARKRQKNLISRTRRISKLATGWKQEVRSDGHGFVTGIQLDILKQVIEDSEQVCEIILTVSIGSYVSCNDVIAQIFFSSSEEQADLHHFINQVRTAIDLEQSRDLIIDPAYGILQLETIAWAVTSPSKSHLAPGLDTVYSLRNLLARWANEENPVVEDETLPVIYNDNVIGTLIHTFESLAIVASTSKEHQVTAEILNSFSILFSRLPTDWQAVVEDSILRIIPTLEQHVLSSKLEKAANDLIACLYEMNRIETASRIQAVLSKMQLY